MSAPPDQTPPVVYRKLTRMHRGVGAMTQLWLGGDHLLQVMSTGYTETYRRFYLGDIQSLLIVHTASRTYIALTLGVLVLITGLIMRAADSGPVGYAIMAACFLPFFLWNQLLGPGCSLVVVTAVQQENVRSVSRLPKARRVLAELTPLIEAAQSGLATAESTGTTPPMPPPLPPS